MSLDEVEDIESSCDCDSDKCIGDHGSKIMDRICTTRNGRQPRDDQLETNWHHKPDNWNNENRESGLVEGGIEAIFVKKIEQECWCYSLAEACSQSANCCMASGSDQGRD